MVPEHHVLLLGDQKCLELWCGYWPCKGRPGSWLHDMHSVQVTSWRIASPMKQLFGSWRIWVWKASLKGLLGLLCSEALTQIVQKNLQFLTAEDSHLHMISICKVGKSKPKLRQYCFLNDWLSVFSVYLVSVLCLGATCLCSLSQPLLAKSWHLLPRPGQRADCSLRRYGPLA